jgi:hypothetical protein
MLHQPSAPALFLLLVCLPGCRTFQQAKFNHGEGLGTEPVLVVPFSEPKNHRWFGESDRGLLVAEAFKTWAGKHADADFPEGDQVDEALRAVRDWKKEKILLDDWKLITADIGVKFVVCGQIDEVALTQRNMIGLLEPSVKATYRVIDVQRNKVVFQRPSFTVEYGTTKEREPQIVDFGSDSASAEKRLITKLGQQIAKDLYGYYEESS